MKWQARADMVSYQAELKGAITYLSSQATSELQRNVRMRHCSPAVCSCVECQPRAFLGSDMREVVSASFTYGL